MTEVGLQLETRCPQKLGFYPPLEKGRCGYYRLWWLHFKGMTLRSLRTIFLGWKDAKKLLWLLKRFTYIPKGQRKNYNDKFSKINSERKGGGNLFPFFPREHFSFFSDLYLSLLFPRNKHFNFILCVLFQRWSLHIQVRL